MPAELPRADGPPDPCPGGLGLLSRAGPPPSGLSSIEHWLLGAQRGVKSVCPVVLGNSTFVRRRLHVGCSRGWEGNLPEQPLWRPGAPGGGISPPWFAPLGCSPVTCPAPTAPVCPALPGGGPNDPGGLFFFFLKLLIYLAALGLSYSTRDL